MYCMHLTAMQRCLPAIQTPCADCVVMFWDQHCLCYNCILNYNCLIDQVTCFPLLFDHEPRGFISLCLSFACLEGG